MEKLTDIKSLLIIQNEWLLDAESLQFIEFPKMAARISNDIFRGIIQNHIRQTEPKINRIEQVFYQLHEPVRRRPCAAMNALLDEALELMDYSFTHEVMDAGLLVCFQKAMHYEIAAYGSACAFAEILIQQKAANLLHENLEQEKLTDNALSKLAEETINPRAIMPNAIMAHEEVGYLVRF